MERNRPLTWLEARDVLRRLAAQGPCLLDRADGLPIIAARGRVLEAVVLEDVAHLVVRESQGRSLWRMNLVDGKVVPMAIDDYLVAQERLAAHGSRGSPGAGDASETTSEERPIDFRPCFVDFPRRDGPPPSLEGPWPAALDSLLASAFSPGELHSLAAPLRRLIAARGFTVESRANRWLEQLEVDNDRRALAELLTTQPLVRAIAMVSVHGWFSQHGVLGEPDTGGQVTYVLEQARCLEQALRAQHASAGLTDTPRVIILTRLLPDAEGTGCDQRLEKIEDTVDSWIVRVPFRHADGSIVRPWLSRFAIIPYLEAFAAEAADVVEQFLGQIPEIVVGHYTDGNLVARELQRRWHNLHVACVHLLERTKHRPRALLGLSIPTAIQSDRDMPGNGVSDECLSPIARESLLQQSLADVWGYNSADLILSSTRREVQFDGSSASPAAPGMLETYEWFTIPGRFRVAGGIDPRLARHYVVPPGVDECCFHVGSPPAAVDRTEGQAADPVEACLRSHGIVEEAPGLALPGRPWIFAIARLDPAKNISGLVDAYGRSEPLRRRANLLIISSTNDWRTTDDEAERLEARRIEALIQAHQLEGQVWWLAARLTRAATGDLFRAVARSGGVFSQPARFETFGLTVLEAMACGLPVAATCHGGPAEILREGRDGELADPDDAEAFAAAILRLLESPDRWRACAEAGTRRVAEAYAWPQHGRSFLALAGLHALLREAHPARRARHARRAPPFPRFPRPE